MATSPASRPKPRLRAPRLIINSSFFAALADPTRIRVMQFLCTPGAGEMQSFAAGDIARNLNLPPSTLSHHLKLLTAAGLLRMTKEGKEHHYRFELEAMAAEFQRSLDQARLLQRTAEGVAKSLRAPSRPARREDDDAE